jgi:dihydrofolate reductase
VRKLVYYVGATIDGFIAAPDGSADFYPVTPDVIDFITTHYPDALPTHVREQLGVDVPNPNFDVGVQGRTTYQPALDIGVTSPFAHLRQYVVSTGYESEDPAVEIISTDVVGRIRELKAEDGKDIYLIGGSRLAGSLLAEIRLDRPEGLPAGGRGRDPAVHHRLHPHELHPDRHPGTGGRNGGPHLRPMRSVPAAGPTSDIPTDPEERER